MGWGHSPNFYAYRSAEEWNRVGVTGSRLSFTDDETVTKLGMGYLANQGWECAMDAAVRYTLLNAGENATINAKQMLNQHTRLAALIEENIMADGWYRVEGKPTRGWVVATDFRPLWRNGMCSEWDLNKTHFPASCINTKEENESTSTYNRYYWNRATAGGSYNRPIIAWDDNLLVTIPLEGNERMLTNHLEDKVVLRAINKSLNRMVKSEKAVQVTAGRGRTFRWDAWDWLDTIRNQRLVTMAKQRKLGDIVNGWKFTKGRVTTTYGVEVCEHAWEPVESFKWYKVCLLGWNNFSYTLNGFFFDESEAEAYKDSLPELPSGGYPMGKTDGVPKTGTYHVESNSATFILKPELMVEELPTPIEMFKRTQLGPAEYYKKVRNEYSTPHGRQRMGNRITNY